MLVSPGVRGDGGSWQQKVMYFVIKFISIYDINSQVFSEDANVDDSLTCRCVCSLADNSALASDSIYIYCL